jgi:hypothetical protein
MYIFLPGGNLYIEAANGGKIINVGVRDATYVQTGAIFEKFSFQNLVEL